MNIERKIAPKTKYQQAQSKKLKFRKMISELMIKDFLSLQEPILRRTRASTNKFYEDNKLELIKSKKENELQIFVYELNKKHYEVKVLPDEEIVDVSCQDCKGNLSM